MAFAWGDAAGAVVNERRAQRTEASELEQMLADRAYKNALIQQEQQRMAQRQEQFGFEQEQARVDADTKAADRRQAGNERGVQSMVGELIRREGITPQNRGQIIGTLVEAGRMPTAADLGTEAPEQFTLGPGQARFDASGKQVAAGPTPVGAAAGAPQGFTLSPGQIRYDAEGKQIASGAPRPTPAGGGAGGRVAPPADPASAKFLVDTADRTLKAIDGVLPDINAMTAGFVGNALSNIPGTSAANVSAELASVSGNVAFNALQQMRAASRTGGALGAITERELDLLSSVEGSIRQNQSPANLKQQLELIRQSMQRIRDAAAGGSVVPDTGGGSGVQRWGRDAQGRPVRLQ